MCGVNGIEQFVWRVSPMWIVLRCRCSVGVTIGARCMKEDQEVDMFAVETRTKSAQLGKYISCVKG